MTIINFNQLLSLIELDKTLAGLDVGSKNIGFALSDRLLNFAFPSPPLRRKKFLPDASALIERFRKEQVIAVIVGLPVNMNGTEGPSAQLVRAFVRNMEALSDIAFLFQDERLSTVAAERSLLEMDLSRKKRAMRIDSAAAAFILQGILDRIRLHSESPLEN